MISLDRLRDVTVNKVYCFLEDLVVTEVFHRLQAVSWYRDVMIPLDDTSDDTSQCFRTFLRTGQSTKFAVRAVFLTTERRPTSPTLRSITISHAAKR